MDNFSKRRIYVHLVPAPWSRVIVLSLVYAFAVNFVKILWFQYVGRPNWYPSTISAEDQSLHAATTVAAGSSNTEQQPLLVEQ